MADRDVMLAYPHAGTVRGEFMSRMLVIVHDGESRVGQVSDVCWGPGISMARNQLAQTFLDSDMEWLWWVDTDMVVGVGTLPALLSHADPETRPVVGALACVLQENKVKATIYETTRTKDGDFGFKHIAEWPADTLLQVDATGAACLLVHRSVFEKLDAKHPEEAGLWFTPMVIDGHELGEDMSFCMRLAMAEIPCLVHTGIEVGHMKPMQLGNVSPQ